MIGRRAFLNGLAAAGAGSLVGARPTFSAEQPLETTRLRLAQQPSICVAPQFIVTDLLKAEGFTDITQELRARKVGHVVVNSAVDRPWSQYFCCFATGHREAGMIKSTPQRLIAQGTDWRFFNELKRELKG